MISSFFLLTFLGGHGGVDHFSNGEGGWSYFNPDAVLRVLDVRMNPTHSVLQLSASGSQPNGAAASLPHLWTNQGQGQVSISLTVVNRNCY